MNPIKPSLVNCAKDYTYATFHKYVALGLYDKDWGCDDAMDFDDIFITVGDSVVP